MEAQPVRKQYIRCMVCRMRKLAPVGVEGIEELVKWRDEHTEETGHHIFDRAVH